MKDKLTILLLCLLVLASAQNQCSESKLQKIQTGEIILSPNDLNSAGASKNYYESLETAGFKKEDTLAHAFAIAGFEASCSQTHYSLVVDIVQPQNQNTKMKIVIDFKSKENNTLTTWTKIKLTYLVVSSSRTPTPGSSAHIWAVSQQVQLGAPINAVAIFNEQIFRETSTGKSGCGLKLDGSNYKYRIYCTDFNSGTVELDVAVHSYIMGFRYQPTKTNSKFLAASVKHGLGMSGSESQVAFATGDTSRASGYPVQFIYSANPTDKNGPKYTISNYDGGLKSIKVALVMTVINKKGDSNGFNLGSPLTYSYSGLFTDLASVDYNIRTMIDSDKTKDFNNLQEKLPVPKYKIYGLSSFELRNNSGCSSMNLDISIGTASSYTVTLNNKDYFEAITFQADVYFPPMSATCTPGVQFNTLTTTVIPQQINPTLTPQINLAKATGPSPYPNLKHIKTRISQKYATVPSNNVRQYIQQKSDNPLDIQFVVIGILDDVTKVRLNAEVIMNGLTDGKPYGVHFLMHPTIDSGVFEFPEPADGSLYQFNVKVNGLNLYTASFTGAELQKIADGTNKQQQFFGVNIKGNTAKFQYSLIIPRFSTIDKLVQKFRIATELFQFQEVYDPVAQCCVAKCPAQTGLDVAVTPASCVVCDISKGLTYDPSTSSCKCADSFYLNSALGFQCFPCETKLCAVCDPQNTNQCETCSTGAVLNNLDNTCSCGSGFYENNGTCSTCPHRCATCKVSTTCDTCADSRRDINNNCSCAAGSYDAGVDKCETCNPSCATCSNSTTCLTCDAKKFRTLKQSVCVCENGFFEMMFENGTKTCKACSSECKTCSQSSLECTTCDSSINRIQGYDSLGHRTCICKAGYHALPDGSCVQSNCNADKYCSQCQKDLALCIQCRASINRVIKLPEHICVCVDGFYQDSTGTCKPCADGCSKCSSLTNCTSCVAQATPSASGTCECAISTYFGVSTNGVRFCQKCVQYCDKCTSGLTCNTCKSGFILSSDNTCICPKQFFINPQGQCVPCKSGCESCLLATTCSKCAAPLVVQENNCVSKCGASYFLAGATCVACPKNCEACTSTNQCFYCKDNFYLNGGACYASCPPGTVANKDKFQCVPCNSPCRTCSNHPSTCTSCEPGAGYLQITSNEQKCVKQCAEGTFPKNNVCEVCDFRCAKCLGAANNCIACPANSYLYKGACWDYCPGVMVSGNCVNECPSGFFRLSDQQCKPCSSECLSCDKATSCLTCANNFVSKQGKCVAECGAGYYAFRGLCVACDKSCKSCKNIPTQCTECATGYVSSGLKCVASCAAGTFLDSATKSCKSCASTCKTCSSDSSCTSCPNESIVPVGGQCLSCIYPCQSCSSDLLVCKSCLRGFSLSSNECVRNCPGGTRPVNGVCTCSSGIFLDGTCVSSCPAGYTKIGSSCSRCESPCTECAGSSSFCTDCLDTYSLNPSTGKCAQTSSCNYGQQEISGKCERICEEGSYYQNGACIFGGCPDGFKNSGFGGCVNAFTNTNKCQVPTFRLNSACVQKCGNGLFPNTNTRNCDLCASNCQNCLNKNYCLNCATGFTALEGRCVPQSNCPATQFYNNRACVASCPNGTFTINGRCIRSCPAGTFYFGAVCYDTCPTQAKLYTDNTCVASCPIGAALIDGICAILL